MKVFHFQQIAHHRKVAPKLRSHHPVKHLKSIDHQNSVITTTVDIPGLNHIITNKRNIGYKMIWFLLMIVSLVICIYQIGDRMLYYLSEPLTTEVTTDNVKTVKFPSVTICPFAGQYPKLQYYQKLFPENEMLPCKRSLVYLYSLLGIYFDVNTLWTLTSIKENTAVAFKFPGDRTQPYQNVTNASTLYGMCHTYTYPAPEQYKHVDWLLRITISIGTDCLEQGYVTIRPDEDYPEFHMNQNMDTVFKGDIMKYALTEKKIYRRSIKRRPCGKSDEVVKCGIDCFNDLLKELISCRNPDMPNYQDIPVCNDATSFMESTIVKYTTLRDFDPILNCSHCKVKCEETVFTRNLARVGNVGGDGVASRTASVEYFFPSSKIDVIREEIGYSFISFVSDVGGNLGLFLGLSLISLVEIIECSLFGILKTVKKSMK